jgi:hypothetical protein
MEIIWSTLINHFSSLNLHHGWFDLTFLLNPHGNNMLHRSSYPIIFQSLAGRFSSPWNHPLKLRTEGGRHRGVWRFGGWLHLLPPGDAFRSFPEWRKVGASGAVVATAWDGMGWEAGGFVWETLGERCDPPATTRFFTILSWLQQGIGESRCRLPCLLEQNSNSPGPYLKYNALWKPLDIPFHRRHCMA